MTTCLIALGGNLGDVPLTFSRALERLAEDDSRVVAASGVVRSAAIGSAAGGEFLNAAAAVETSLSPERMLARLHEVESGLARRRDVRWGPRTIDLDLITHGMTCSEEPALRLPHPGCWWRRFVLDPVVEIAGDEIYPVTGETFGALRGRLLARPFLAGLASDVPAAWVEGVMERLGALGEQIDWTGFEDDTAAIRFEAGRTVNAPAERLLGVPGDEEGFVEMASAVLAAAVGESKPERGRAKGNN